MASFLIDNFQTGWQTDKSQFSVENDAFPVLRNAVVDHGRVAKTVGYVRIGATAIEVTGSIAFTLDVDTSLYTADLTSLLTSIPSSHAKLIARNSITITFPDDSMRMDINGDFSNGGSVNYATGICSFDSTLNPNLTTASVTFSYHPMLPTTGIARISDTKYLVFDVDHAYNVNTMVTTGQNLMRDSSYLSSGSLCTFTGLSHNLFSFATVNNRLFCTNGVSGRNVLSISNITSATNAVVTIFAGTLKVDDLIFFNEVQGMTEINGYTAKVTAVNNLQVTTDLDTSSFSAYSTGGILQVLTENGSGTGIKYYYQNGFVNFAPPLDGSATPNYLWGCRTLIYYNNTLVCFGTYEGTASGDIQFYPLRVRYSSSAQVFYATHTDLGSSVGNLAAESWREDVITLTLGGGNGGFLDLQTGDSREIRFAQILENYIVVGLDRGMVRLQFASGIISFVPFFYDSILGSFSPQIAVHVDKAVISVGGRGIIATDTKSISRIDNNIIEEIENIEFTSIAASQSCGSRDIKREFVYLSYVENMGSFPTKSFVFNYNNNSFALLDEKLTCQAQYRARSLATWGSISTSRWGEINGRWIQFTDSTFISATAIGNSQGNFLIRQESDEYDYSVLIESIVPNDELNSAVVNARNHSMMVGDFLAIPEAFDQAVCVTSTSTNSFTVDGLPSSNYTGLSGGIFLPQVSIRTKAFRPFWNEAKRTNLISTSLLLESNPSLAFSLNIYSDQDFDNVASSSTLLPESKGSQENLNPVRWVKSIYTNYEADSIQLEITFSEEQIRNTPLGFFNFVLHGILMDLEEGGDLS